jgi:hypothetical protein
MLFSPRVDRMKQGGLSEKQQNISYGQIATGVFYR